MQKKVVGIVSTVLVLALMSLAAPVQAEYANPAKSGTDADLAQDLTNPVAELITVPIQMNYDQNIGLQDNGEKLQTNIQPVIPFGLADDWNLISRTILPVVYQDDIFPGEGSQFGLGDTTFSLFLSPKKSTSGIFWGVGPILLLPTATDSLLGAEKWGAGPTAVGLMLLGPWTLGTLFNHISECSSLIHDCVPLSLDWRQKSRSLSV